MMADFSIFRMTKGTDEILFGEIVKMMVREGYPMINLVSSEDVHTARFLMPGTDFFWMELSMKRYTSGFVLSKMTDVLIRLDLKGMAILKGVTFNKIMEMYKTNISNITKFPFLGDIKIRHQYNRIHVWAAIVGRGSKYFLSKDTLDSDHLGGDLRNAFSEMQNALEKFLGDEDMDYVDETLNLEDGLDRIQAKVVEKIEDPLTITVQCPNCNERFDTILGKAVLCPNCGLTGDIGN
jgi:hypothetical protein